MNAKQAAPLIGTLPILVEIAAAMPPLIILGGIGVGGYYLLKWLSSDDKEEKPETVPANTETEFRRNEAETPAFRPVPAEIPVKPAPVPVSSAPTPFIPPVSVPTAPKVSAPMPVAVAIPKIVAQAPSSPPIKKKFVTREDLATVFQHGARALSRTAAVAALKKLGFGKSASYDALLEDGRFSTWLQFAPDGIITWTE